MQFSPTRVTWTGLFPDEYEPTDNPDFDWRRYREGHFEGTVMLTILALTSEERDRLWDGLANLFLAGRLHPASADFYATLENHDLVAMTIIEGDVNPVGTSTNPGTPWGTEELTYEASISVPVIGQFRVDSHTQQLVSVESIQTYVYREDDPGFGTWAEPQP